VNNHRTVGETIAGLVGTLGPIGVYLLSHMAFGVSELWSLVPGIPLAAVNGGYHVPRHRRLDNPRALTGPARARPHAVPDR
jgi:hypothetical protein